MNENRRTFDTAHEQTVETVDKSAKDRSAITTDQIAGYVFMRAVPSDDNSRQTFWDRRITFFLYD